MGFKVQAITAKADREKLILKQLAYFKKQNNFRANVLSKYRIMYMNNYWCMK